MTEQIQTEKGITLEKLLGIKTIKCKRLKATLGRMTGTEERRPILEVEILEGEHEGLKMRYGLVTEQVVKKVLATSIEEGDDVIVYLPEPDPSVPINWVNYL